MPRQSPAKARPKATTAKSKKQVSNASAFKKKKTHELELPSGEVCLARRPGIESLMADGVFSDGLLPIISDAVSQGKNGKKGADIKLDPADIMKDPKLLRDLMSTYDMVAAKCIAQPHCRFHKFQEGDEIPEGYKIGDDIPDELRDDDVIYTDDVDLNDKIFIFQWVVGGSDDVARFREESSKSLAALSDGEDVQDSPE